MDTIDVKHLGQEKIVAIFRQDDFLIDCGPQSCEVTLLEELGDWRPRALLLTHIHFDHAGAAGALVRRWPDLEVYVHERGARHLVDPERLVDSATRLYGDRFDLLWGEVVPIPQENIRVIVGGETLFDDFEVAYTPGHASHHVSYFHRPSGVAFVGDVAGVRIPPSRKTIAPTPPPDIDVEAWHNSLDAIAAWNPTALALTHFGVVEDAQEQIAAVRVALDEQAEMARTLSEEEFLAEMGVRQGRGEDPETAAFFEQAAAKAQLWAGLTRYWQKRA